MRSFLAARAVTVPRAATIAVVRRFPMVVTPPFPIFTRRFVCTKTDACAKNTLANTVRVRLAAGDEKLAGLLQGYLSAVTSLQSSSRSKYTSSYTHFSGSLKRNANGYANFEMVRDSGTLHGPREICVTCCPDGRINLFLKFDKRCDFDAFLDGAEMSYKEFDRSMMWYSTLTNERTKLLWDYLCKHHAIDCRWVGGITKMIDDAIDFPTVEVFEKL